MACFLQARINGRLQVVTCTIYVLVVRSYDMQYRAQGEQFKMADDELVSMVIN